ncbi:Lar family restriction alleviation protein [Pseudomonas protegens]|uniref:Lar family restriction alleviation protein n=1 Tax=Pseudomonas protegens TaxID=380021 RepID=UPI0038097519
MIEPIKIAPCPFCEGPPCIIARDFITGVEVFETQRRDPDADDQPAFEAHVWCHDCGAQGPNINTCSLGTFEHLYDLEVADVMRIAIERWNNRPARARSCYDFGDLERVTLWPRVDA